MFDSENDLFFPTCDTCLYRDIHEPELVDDFPYLTCSCSSSPLYQRVTRAKDTCQFYIDKNKYSAIFREGG